MGIPTVLRRSVLALVLLAATPCWARQAGEPSLILQATHRRLEFAEDVTRVAVGRSQTMSVEILNSRELLLLGKQPGRTSLTVWFADGRVETFVFVVEPDLSLLREALRDIHPSITIELAPDREAFLLRGLVPDVTYRLAAGEAASAYLDSSSRGGQTTPLVSAGEERPAQPGGGESAEARPAETDELEGAVINLIRLDSLPLLADSKIRDALDPLTGGSVSVRRVRHGDLPDDDQDLFVLEGSVTDQVTLTRMLYLASRALLGDGGSSQNDIRVLADEAGALTNAQNLFGAGSQGGGGGQQGGGNLGGSSRATGGGGNNQQLVNRIGANVGRAKVIEAAGGRILSLVEVEHLPLVRVDVRLYEVNLTRLRQWRNELGIIASDFDQGPLAPSPLATDLQDTAAAAVGQTDVQNVLGFLDGGLSNQLQLVTGGFAVDDLFQLLVSEEIARALSRPSLTVLSGELALFQVGGQVPVPIAVTVGGGTDQVLNAVEFREFGVQLSVRPLVEEHDAETITLDLSPVVSLPDLALTSAISAATGTDQGATAFESRGTRTHTRLRDGDAMLIGGLISQREDAVQGKTPGLGDVPLAGWLFRNEASNSEDFELVIVVNPVIVRPERSDARLWDFASPASILQSCYAELAPPAPAPPPPAEESAEKEPGREPAAAEGHSPDET